MWFSGKTFLVGYGPCTIHDVLHVKDRILTRKIIRTRIIAPRLYFAW